MACTKTHIACSTGGSDYLYCEDHGQPLEECLRKEDIRKGRLIRGALALLAREPVHPEDLMGARAFLNRALEDGTP